jgi:hypothetical protein
MVAFPGISTYSKDEGPGIENSATQILKHNCGIVIHRPGVMSIYWARKRGDSITQRRAKGYVNKHLSV